MGGEAALSFSCGGYEPRSCLYVGALVTYTLALLDALLDVLLGNVWLLVPGVLFGWLVNLRQLLLRRADHVGSLLGGIGCHIADQNESIAHYR